MTLRLNQLVIAIKGAGEMATAIAWRLFQANFKRIFMMETEAPLAVRRLVSFCEAIHDGTAVVEGVEAQRISQVDGVFAAWEKNCIPILVDPGWSALQALAPQVVIDAIIAKKNRGTSLAEAPLVLGLGPGFTAGRDVHMALETNRGHNLGRIMLTGSPEPDTGIPGNISGYTRERVLRAPCAGLFTSPLSIGLTVSKHQVVGTVDQEPVLAQIDGILRGLIRTRTRVTGLQKIGDIDPRGNPEYCNTISEKARAIGGSVLEAILRQYNI